jgi:hypothetical protein
VYAHINIKKLVLDGQVVGRFLESFRSYRDFVAFDIERTPTDLVFRALSVDAIYRELPCCVGMAVYCVADVGWSPAYLVVRYGSDSGPEWS